MHLIGAGKTIVHRADKMNYDSSLFKILSKNPDLIETGFYMIHVSTEK